VNPSATGDGLLLNISKDDNAQSLDLAMSVAAIFRVKKDRAEEIISEVSSAVRQWPRLAKKMGLPKRETDLMKSAFRV
jgi:serine/threonine-protein kinase HipA